MNIYVPSRGRANRKFLYGAYTVLRWLTPDLRNRTFYVIRDEEVDAYRNVLPKDIGIIPCGSPPNLSEKRKFITEYVQAKGEDKFVMSDDDVMLYVRKSPEAFNLRYPEFHEIDELFRELEFQLDFYPMVGLSAREGNNRAGNGTLNDLIMECGRSMRFYAFRTDDYASIEANRLPEMADFDTTLQFLERGQKNAVLYYWAQGQPGSQHPGGCSAYRTAETHDAVCRRLAELHPKYVSLRQKANKGDQHGFGTRTEVTVQWKRAYDDAVPR